MQEVARELGVRYVLEGSVRRAENHIRVTAQLIDADTGNHIWAERYDRDLNDIFAVQDEITQRIAAAVEPELAKLERQRAKTKREKNLGAWDHVWKGWWHFYRFTSDDCTEAHRQFQNAIEVGPGITPAYTGVAQCKMIQVWFGWTDDKETNLIDARLAAEMALSLDHQDAEAHAQMSLVASYSGEHDDALAEGEVAVDLNPSFSNGHNILGYAKLFSGRLEDAALSFYQALRLSPFDPFKANFLHGLGMSLRLSDRFEEALLAAREAVRLMPKWAQLHRGLAVDLTLLGRKEEASIARQNAMRLDPDYTIFGRQRFRPPFKNPEQFEKLIEGFRKAGLPESAL